MNAISSYISLYEVYEEQLSLNVKEYKAGLEKKKVGLNELLIEIQGHKKDLDEIDRWFDLNPISSLNFIGILTE